LQQNLFGVGLTWALSPASRDNEVKGRESLNFMRMIFQAGFLCQR